MSGSGVPNGGSESGEVNVAMSTENMNIENGEITSTHSGNEPLTVQPSTPKPKDSMFPSYSSRPFVPGESIIEIPHMFDPSQPPIKRSVPNHWLQFQLQPKYFGGKLNPNKSNNNSTRQNRVDITENNDDEKEVIYWDAADPQFYHMTIENPKMVIWLLIKNITFLNGGYVKRRLVEEAIQKNIQIRLMNPNRFDLALSFDSLPPPPASSAAVSSPSSNSEIRPELDSNVITPNATILTSIPIDKRIVIYKGRPVALPDAVIPRVGANVDYFGLAVMRHLESLGVLVFNRTASIEISRDKLYTHQVLGAAGIPIPKSVLSRWPFDISYIERHFNYPLIVKLTSGSKGDAVWKVDAREELNTLITELDTQRPIIFQEFLADTRGRDLRMFVVGDRVVAAMMRIANTGFKANVHQGGTVKSVKVGPILHSLAIDTARHCLLDITGVDVLLDRSSYKICEVNSSPGFAGLEKASEANVADEIISYVSTVVEKNRATSALQASKDVVPMKDVSLSSEHPLFVPLQQEHYTLGIL